MLNSVKPFVLIVLDGFGYREDFKHNAIAMAHTPNWDRLWLDYPHHLLIGSGIDVGLPEGQMGNSEVGHLNIGSGRVVYQEFTRIQHAIQDKTFFDNKVLVQTIQKAITSNSKVHIFGLLSPGGVHSHESQIHAMVKLACAQGIKQLYVHAFLDGRDTPPRSALASIQALEAQFLQTGHGQLASIIGRYYAMDRDKRWDRVQKAYELLTEGKAEFHTTSAIDGLSAAYSRGENDEFIKATAIHPENSNPITVDDGDVIIFMNYRADRAREISRAFIETDFSGFERHKIVKCASFVSLTQYAKDINTEIAYPPEQPQNTLGEYISKLGLKQLRIAETEKYAHVTFFFNGGLETAFPGEDRILVPSLKVATYDLQPEMSASEVTEKLVAAINSQQYSFIVCNFANPDMVGHTGNFIATVKAIEVIDQCIGKIITALQAVGGQAIITADHGNAEVMYDETTQQAHTAHTHEPVPMIYIGHPAKFVEEIGTLSDIAPTILALMKLPCPKEMTGKKLLQLL